LKYVSFFFFSKLLIIFLPVWSDASQTVEATGTKLLVSLGGWGAGVMTSEDFSKLAANDALRSVFVTQLGKFLRTYKFDGVVINWQYPGCREVFFFH
jgi:GH18 family chitinase